MALPYAYTDCNQYFNEVLTVSLDTVFSFLELGSPFILLLTGGDVASKRMKGVTSYFVKQQPVVKFVLHLPVEGDSLEASSLFVSVLPQIRLYNNGVEITRKHGTLGYSGLSKLLL